MNTKQEQLEKSISLAKHQIKRFDKDKLTTESGNIAYNALVVKKAVLVRELQKLKENKFKMFVRKCCRKFNGKKLICDNF